MYGHTARKMYYFGNYRGLFKGTAHVISNDSLFKDWHVQFTTVPLKASFVFLKMHDIYIHYLLFENWSFSTVCELSTSALEPKDKSQRLKLDLSS